jgi:hypothetical protein
MANRKAMSDSPETIAVNDLFTLGIGSINEKRPL